MKNKKNLKKFGVTYTVSYCLEVMAASEEEAIAKARKAPDDDWDGGKTCQFDAEEM